GIPRAIARRAAARPPRARSRPRAPARQARAGTARIARCDSPSALAHRRRARSPRTRRAGPPRGNRAPRRPGFRAASTRPSRRICLCRRYSSPGLRERAGEIEWPIARRVLKTSTELIVAQAIFLPERTLDAAPNLAARASNMARDGGFVLAEQRAGFRQRELLRVIIGKAQPVARSEFIERLSQRVGNHRKVAAAVGIVGFGRRMIVCRKYRTYLDTRMRPILRPPRLRFTLRDHNAQPRGERTAAVVVIQRRTPLPVVARESVKVAVERVDNFARALRIAGERPRDIFDHGTELRIEFA